MFGWMMAPIGKVMMAYAAFYGVQKSMNIIKWSFIT